MNILSRQTQLPKWTFWNNKRIVLPIVMGVLLLIAGIGLFLFSNGYVKAKANLKSYQHLTTISSSYPQSWKKQELTKADSKAGIIAVASRSNPSASYFVRIVEGTFTEGSDIRTLSKTIAGSLAQKLKGFTLISNKTVRRAGFNVVEVHYQQTTVNNNATMDHLMVIVPTQNQAIYLNFTFAQSSYDKLSGEFITTVRNFLNFLSTRAT
ncbi:hypothetical protein A3A71_04120 [Candidatus Berkelbacteria bacterium RIFCSPLOWO2_01_FULL_50_28]|uniref:PsbP C-terminal domain-containing protein n=1 Tax=Candidatus Berkelbacteria bacterium RIFCSPLOWO2_01_FULL_50_28 TaxID=1797471 RepID=A0A1F5EAF0_9BACT|nr:MAG: hypothetical protein A2807_03490 [Candidatus Berkelbacteria bacterium RIFCSPHIGHO2_01_FULL_50_36]OGD62461.1 MAG: hypothetical protein A3F39_02025 [Candidatus Berkelbacteria bacterium RIFCSPHIGHO2_12_FULL_50_11]OGD64321.1 MAG: hypothetical protein A3A71_04120 [Candidatus Berkelbacteria bacterium RIFCSPLOWO2_01_FULL_50_28]